MSVVRADRPKERDKAISLKRECLSCDQGIADLRFGAH